MYWNPSKFIFTIPIIDRPVAYYGLFFFLGFLASYHLAVYVFFKTINPLNKGKNNWELSKELINTALLYSVVLSIIGSRLFHVFFYDWPYYKDHLMEIPMAFDGGLASHGGILGIFLAWYLFYKVAKKKIKKITLPSVLDVIGLTIGLALGSIRIGNFFNQEILGKPTDSIFGVTFGNPMGGLPILSRHPAQLYESFSYFSICLILILIWKKTKFRPGTYFGLANIFYFSARFICEFFKLEQSQLLTDDSLLTMGQIQSIPFIIMGILVILYLNRKKTIA